MGVNKEEHLRIREEEEQEYIYSDFANMIKKQKEASAFQHITKLVINTPNNADLGQKVREYVALMDKI